jgi:hypothetical protein
MRAAPLAATAEVVAQGRLRRDRLYPELDVAYLDVRIVQKLRGKQRREHIRLWDPMFGTSCSLDLRPLIPGSYVAFAAQPASSDLKELFDSLEIAPAADDYLLAGCGTHFERLESGEAARRFPRKTLQP